MGFEDGGGENIGEIDYAILTSLNYLRNLSIKDLDEEIRELSNILQIRSMIIERHFYQLTRNGSIISDKQSETNRYVLTQTGKDDINEFEESNEEWVNIDNFIKTSIEDRKEKRLKLYKTTDRILTIAAIVCVLSIIYIAFFL